MPIAAGGDRIAAREFIERYGSLVWSLARRARLADEQAESVVHDIFADLWKSASGFDPSAVSEPAFVAMIARRHLIARRATSARKPVERFNDVLGVPPADLGSESVEAARVVAELRPEERQALVMTACQTLTHEEVAQTMGAPVATVKENARRGLLQVCEKLGPEGARVDTAHERLVMLLADRALVGLAGADEEELARLLAEAPPGNALARGLELAAAPIAIAAASARGMYPLPNAIFARIEESVQGKATPRAGSRPGTRKPSESKPSFDVGGEFSAVPAKTGTQRRIPPRAEVANVEDISSPPPTKPAAAAAPTIPAALLAATPTTSGDIAIPADARALITATTSDDAPASVSRDEHAKHDAPTLAPPVGVSIASLLGAPPPLPAADLPITTQVELPLPIQELALTAPVAVPSDLLGFDEAPIAKQTKMMPKRPAPPSSGDPGLSAPRQAVALAAPLPPPSSHRLQIPTPSSVALPPVRRAMPSDPGTEGVVRSAPLNIPTHGAFTPQALPDRASAGLNLVAVGGWFAAGALMVVLGVVVTLHLSARPVEATPATESKITPPAVPAAGTTASPSAEREALLARSETLHLEWTHTASSRDAAGDVVWNGVEQRGFLRLRGLPKTEKQKSVYQLFIADRSREDRFPVDGGCFDIDDESAETIIAFKPKLPVTQASAFSISLEKAGGVVVSNRARVILSAAVKER